MYQSPEWVISQCRWSGCKTTTSSTILGPTCKPMRSLFCAVWHMPNVLSPWWLEHSRPAYLGLTYETQNKYHENSSLNQGLSNSATVTKDVLIDSKKFYSTSWCHIETEWRCRRIFADRRVCRFSSRLRWRFLGLHDSTSRVQITWILYISGKRKLLQWFITSQSCISSIETA
jgi:hypothetical protein